MTRPYKSQTTQNNEKNVSTYRHKQTQKGHNMQFHTPAIMLISALLLPFSAIAAPKISLNVRAEIEVSVEENGKQVTKRIEAGAVEPGQEVIYTLSYHNSGDEKATKVNLNNLIPENTSYIANSAWGKNSDIQFSVDSGKSFKKPSLMSYEVSGENGKKEKVQASPEKYTDIRWTVKEIPANKRGEVGFRITVN